MNIRYTPAEFREKIREFAVETFHTQRKAAHAWGVSEQYLSAVIKGKREPSDKILKGIGATRTSFTSYLVDEPDPEGLEDSSDAL